MEFTAKKWFPHLLVFLEPDLRRGGIAVAPRRRTGICRGGGSRRRRGCDVDIPRGTWTFREGRRADNSERGGRGPRTSSPPCRACCACLRRLRHGAAASPRPFSRRLAPRRSRRPGIAAEATRTAAPTEPSLAATNPQGAAATWIFRGSGLAGARTRPRLFESRTPGTVSRPIVSRARWSSRPWRGDDGAATPRVDRASWGVRKPLSRL